MSATEALNQLRDELERIGELLADAAMDILREGLSDGSDAQAALAARRERLVNRARSSVSKAARLLGESAAASELTLPRSAPSCGERFAATDDWGGSA